MFCFPHPTEEWTGLLRCFKFCFHFQININRNPIISAKNNPVMDSEGIKLKIYKQQKLLVGRYGRTKQLVERSFPT